MKLILVVLAFSMLAAPQTWRLDEPKTVPAITRDYRLSMEYDFADAEGRVQRNEYIAGTYTLSMPNAAGIWKDVTLRNGSNDSVKLDYMQGLRCGLPNGADAFKPEFFKDFPPNAFEARNVVWDTVMFLSFAKVPFGSLKLNEAYKLPPDEKLDLAGTGTFSNKNLELTWSGYSERNGKRCALIDYRAYFNPLTINAPGTTMKGRSHYWGQLWIALETKTIEYATLYEDVLLQITPTQGAPLVTDVFRTGIFAPVN